MGFHHDQMLGGPSGQSYLGAIFPADPAYSRLITREAAKIGQRFVREGIIGRFAVDFLTVQNSAGEWQPYAIEVNLRKGGTTHPFLTLQYLTDGTYDPESGVFTTELGERRYYVASDHVESNLAARRLEIFLDRMAWSASRTAGGAHEYLLDDHYRDLIGDDTEALHRSLAARI